MLRPSRTIDTLSLRKNPFLLALRRWGRFAKRPRWRRARRNGCFRRLRYPGCQRLFMRGFRLRSSLKKSPARKVFSRGFAARVFGRRLKTCRPAAHEAPRLTREKISGTQGKPSTTTAAKQRLKSNFAIF